MPASFNTAMGMHETSFHIRAMRIGDLDAILAIQAACYPPAMQEPAAVVLARMGAAPETCVVAQDGGGVSAYLFAYPSRLGVVTALDTEFEVAVDADTLYLHDLSVAPRAVGRGLARRLVTQLLAQAEGCQWSALVSVQDTAGFWTSLGFRPADVVDAEARTALAGYPGSARYMLRALTGPGAPSPNC